MSQSVSALAAGGDDVLQSAIQKNLVRVVPILAIAYSFNYIDRTNVGAALQMNQDIGCPTPNLARPPLFMPALIGISFGAIGLSPVRPALHSLPSRYLTDAADAGGIAFINSVGSQGGYVGP